MEGKKVSPELMEFSSGKVLPPNSDVDKESLVVEDASVEENRDLELEFHEWINGEKVPEEGSALEKEEKGKAPQDIIATIKFLKQNSFRVAFNEFGRSSDLTKDTITKTIENIKKYNNYFIDAKLKQIEQKPLDNDKWPLSMRKALLKAEIGNIKHDNIVNQTLLNKLKSDILSDKEIDYIFNAYREFNPEYFYWLENHDRRDDYHDQFLVNGYNIIPKLAEDNYDKLQITRDCCYSKMSKKYAAIYTPQGNIDSFFQVDQELNQENEDIKQRNGNISESNLEYFLNKFKKDVEGGKLDNLHYYLQIRKSLPEEISRDIDEELNLFIPEKLDKNFDSMDKFEKAITYSGNEIVEYFKEMDKEKQEYLVNSFESLLNRRKEEAGEKYFGFCSEDIEILDFYKAFLKRNPNSIKPNAHFSVCYYLYLRKDLPEDLVNDFEEKFSIEIPDKFKSFDNQDDYLKISDKDLLEPFKKPFRQKIEGIDNEVLSADFIKMQEYLYEKIDELDQRIKNTKIQPERLDIDEVLTGEGFNKNNIKGKDYDRLVSVYETLIELPMREKIENEFGIELKDFNIREQVQFVNFLSSKSKEEVEEVKEFLNQGGSEEAKNNRIKSFLSLESGELGEEMGNKILDIGKNIDAEGGDAIFAKYAEIIDLIEKNKEELETLFKNKKDISDEETQKISQNLIDKAGQILVNFSDKIDKGGEIEKNEVLVQLKDINKELILAASVYKAMDKNEVRFEDLEGVVFEQRTADEIFSDKNTADQMIKIYAKNYADKPKLQELVIKGLENVLENQGDNTHFYLYMKGKDLIAFNRFDKINENRKHFGSFNVDPSIRGMMIGRALLEASLTKEAEKNELEADCVPTAPISECYLNECGFVVKKVIPNYENTGETLFHIEKSSKYENYNNISLEEIEKEYNEKSSSKELVSTGDHFVLKFKPGSEELYNTSQDLINEKGYIMVKYFSSNDGKEIYCAFEKEK